MNHDALLKLGMVEIRLGIRVSINVAISFDVKMEQMPHSIKFHHKSQYSRESPKLLP